MQRTSVNVFLEDLEEWIFNICQDHIQTRLLADGLYHDLDSQIKAVTLNSFLSFHLFHADEKL